MAINMKQRPIFSLPLNLHAEWVIEQTMSVGELFMAMFENHSSFHNTMKHNAK
jgi:hypothetical protein